MRVRIFLIVSIVLSVTVLAERTPLKPATEGSAAAEIKLGMEVAKEAEKVMAMVSNRDANTYITALGQKLVAKAPNPNRFSFTFKLVDDKQINAFALPGGPIFVNRGAIEAADNEAQVAGVLGHEIGHVLLRHAAAQQKRGSFIGAAVVGLPGPLAGNRAPGKAIAGTTAFGVNAYLLKYSRGAESEADLVGAQILYDSGYDPKAMAEFFDKVAKENKGLKTEDWFSNHPIPENRIAKVNEEIKRIGPPLSSPRTDSPDFQRIKKLLLAMPVPKPETVADGGASVPAASRPPLAASAQTTELRVGTIQLFHPTNWKSAVKGTNITIAPPGGVDDQGDLVRGMIIDVFTPQNAQNLDQATDQLVAALQKGSPAMKIVRSRVQTRVDNWPAQLTEVSNNSPAGGRETDIIITLLRSNNWLRYFILVAPTKDRPQYDGAFQAIMNSVRLRQTSVP